MKGEELTTDGYAMKLPNFRISRREIALPIYPRAWGNLRMKSSILGSMVLGALLSCQALANGAADNVTVAETAIGRGYGSFVFIRLSGAPSGSASCAGTPVASSWHFTLALDDTASSKAMYAMLLSAQASGQKVRAVGAGACSEFGTIESLSTLNFVTE